MKIFLIGFMGSGKTTSGQALAEALHLPFIDIDQQIEISEKTSINDIFTHYSESYFRELETKFLHNSYMDAVYATGGGIICNTSNGELLRKKADLIIWLNPVWDTIYQRIAHSDRPIVQNSDQRQLQELFFKRLPLYKAVANIEYQGSDILELIKIIKKARR